MKRNINIGRPKLSPQEIARFKNFSTINARFRNPGKPFFRKSWFYGNVFVVTIGVIALIYLDNPGQPDSATNLSSTVSFVNPPVKGLDIAYSKYTVSSLKGAELNYATGTIINIPENAFVDENNQLVNGEIEIHYREFHDAADFFISGIPMTYDSAGEKYHFESAGMMEILAFNKGKAVFMNPEKKIQIKMASQYSGSEYNLYYLDTVKKNWDCEGKDSIVSVAGKTEIATELPETSSLVIPIQKSEVKQVEQKINKAKEELVKLEKEKPVEPKKVDKKKYTFNIEVDPKEFPELAVYKNAQFEVGEENKNFSPKMYRITWESAELSEKVKGKNYNLTLTKGEQKHHFVVYPVYDGKSYEDAMEIFKNKFEEYQVKLKEARELEERLRKEYEAKAKKKWRKRP